MKAILIFLRGTQLNGMLGVVGRCVCRYVVYLGHALRAYHFIFHPTNLEQRAGHAARQNLFKIR